MMFSTQGLFFGMRDSKRRRHLLLGALIIFSLLITLVQPMQKAVAALSCTGNGTTTLLDTTDGGETLKSVTGSTALDRSSPANLVSNGDFTTEPAALASSAQPNYYYWSNNGVTYLAQKNVQATLALGTNVINLSKGNTLNINPGDAVTEVAGAGGKLNVSPVFVGSITSSTQFTVVDSGGAAANHSVAGFIVMSPIYLLDKSINTPVPSWNASGGGSASYPTWVRSSAVMDAIKLYPPLSNGQSDGRVYLGNKFVTSFSPALNFDAAGYSMASYTFVHDAIWGGNANPIAIDQNITTVAGTTYRMHFSQGGEDGRYPFANWVEADGIAAVDITGFQRVFFKVSPANSEYYLEFVATSSQTNIKFMSWGHVTYNRVGYTTVPGTELALDDVIVNVCTSGPPAPTAVNDAQSSVWDTNQTYSPMANDSAGSGTTLDSSSMKLCPTNATSPYNASNCSLSSVTVAGQGVYTLSGSTVTFNPDSTFFGVVSTPVRYVITDVLGQYANAIITPTIGPKATAGTLSLAPGATGTFTAITGSGGLATGAALNTAGTFLCAAGETAPSCTATTVTVAGVGVYTLNQSTGVVTLVADANATAGQKASLTYVVTDSTGMKASSTLTPTIGPIATPDTLSLAPGGTATFAAITGSGGLATGAALNTAGTFLCGAGETAPNCTATTVTVAGVGVYTLNQSTGVVTLVADAGATAGQKASLTYVVTDSTGMKASSTLTPTIALLPPAPVAVNDAQTTAWDTNQTYSPMANDSSDTSTALNNSKFKLCPSGATSPYGASNCSATSVTISGQGVYTLSGTTVTFNPDATFFGVATPIQYVIADGFNQYASATITPTIGPKATPNTLSLAPGATASFAAITGSGGLATGAALNTAGTFLCGAGETATACTSTTVTVAGVGVYTLNQSTGVVTLVADANATAGAKAALIYVVTDSTGLKASSTLTPTIATPPPPTPTYPPAAQPDTSTDVFQAVQKLSILGNDVAGTGAALIPSSIKLCAGTQVAPSCTATSVEIPSQGTFTLGNDGVVTFTPTSTFTGTATTIGYQVTDSSGQVASSTITVIVGPPGLSVASPDTTTNFKGITQSYNLLANDKAATGVTLDALTLKFCAVGESVPTCTATSVTIAGQGTYAVGAAGVVTFTPEANFVGTATALPYVVKDSMGRTISSTYTPIVRDIPIATPDTSSDAFQQVQTLSILGNDAASTGANLVASSIKLCALNEVVPNCTATSLLIPVQGMFTLGANGVVTFTPETNFVGTATTITYQVTDSSGQIASSTITVTVGPPPLSVANPDTTTDFKGITQSYNLLTNDKAATGLTLDSATLKFCANGESVSTCTATSVTIAGQGTYAVGASGVVTFTPEADFVGTATSLPYVVKDSLGRTISSTYTPIVRDFPIAIPNSSAGPFQQIQTLSILGNDLASTGATLIAASIKLCAVTEVAPNCTATSVVIPNEGTFTLGADGVVTFKPVATFTGTAKTIGYQVSDSSTQIAPSTITVTVGPPPNGPKALDDARITQVNVPVTLDPTVNDIPGSLPLVPNTVLLCLPSQAVGMCTATSVKKSTGTFKVDKKTGLVTFTPKSGWTGVTKVPYIVRDSYGALAAAIITVTIKPAAYLELKELAWTGAKPALKSHPAVKVPDSSLGNGKTVATMRIPKLGSNWQQTVLNGISQKNLSTGLGYYPGTALPGALGNFAVAGHRITRGHPFLNLDRLVTGDSIAVQVGNKIYLYKVTSTKVVEPTSVSVIFPVPGNLKGIASGAILTLTTCTPKNSAEKRLIVHAALDSILDAATAPNKFKSKA